jgi:hypothetical protein
VDFRWYGGVQPVGYSLLTPPLMAWAGPRPVGAAAAVVSTLALFYLLRRTGATRPGLGAVLGAVAFTGNLVSGRVTFGAGIALGLLALAMLVAGSTGGVPGGGPRRVPERRGGRAVPERRGGRAVPERRGGRAVRWAGAGALAGLAAATSPVAGLFVGLAGTAILLGAVRPASVPAAAFTVNRRQWAPDRAGDPAVAPAGGLALAAGAAVPIAVLAGLFGSGGWRNISRSDTVHAVVASLAVAALVPHRLVRIGAVLSAAGVLVAYLVPTPVGLNATRLATLFTLPLVAAYATVPGRLAARLKPAAVWLVPVLGLLAWWQPPVLDSDLASLLRAAAGRAGRPSGRPGGGRADRLLLGVGAPRSGPAGAGLAAPGRSRPEPAVLRRHPRRRLLPALAGRHRRVLCSARRPGAVLGGPR